MAYNKKSPVTVGCENPMFTSPDGTVWIVKVDNTGKVSTTAEKVSK